MPIISANTQHSCKHPSKLVNHSSSLRYLVILSKYRQNTPEMIAMSDFMPLWSQWGRICFMICLFMFHCLASCIDLLDPSECSDIESFRSVFILTILWSRSKDSILWNLKSLGVVGFSELGFPSLLWLLSNSADVVDAERGLYKAYKLRYGSSFFDRARFDRARVVWTPSGSTVRQRLESVQKKFSQIAIRLLGLV